MYINWACYYKYAEPREKSKKDKLSKRRKGTYKQTNKQTNTQTVAEAATSKNRKKRTTHHHSQQQQQQRQDKNISRQLLLLFLTLSSSLDSNILYIWPLHDHIIM